MNAIFAIARDVFAVIGALSVAFSVSLPLWLGWRDRRRRRHAPPLPRRVPSSARDDCLLSERERDVADALDFNDPQGSDQ